MSNYNLPPAEGIISKTIIIDEDLVPYFNCLTEKQPQVGGSDEEFLNKKLRLWVMQEYAQIQGMEMAEGKKQEVEVEKGKIRQVVEGVLK